MIGPLQGYIVDDKEHLYGGNKEHLYDLSIKSQKPEKPLLDISPQTGFHSDQGNREDTTQALHVHSQPNTTAAHGFLDHSFSFLIGPGSKPWLFKP